MAKQDKTAIVKGVAVVTGAAQGIGQAVAAALARWGANVVGMVDRSDAVIAAAKAITTESEGQVRAVPFVGDVTDDAFRQNVFAELTAKYGTPTICVPAAGITRDKLAVRINKETGKAVLYPKEDFLDVLKINLVAPTYWAMEMIGKIAESRRARGLKEWAPPEEFEGTVVFIGSVSAHGIKGQVAYSATKAGLHGVAGTLMKEATYYGVRCLVLHPGFTDTAMVRALGEDYIKTKILPQTWLKRLIRPEEIGNAVVFMAADPAVSGDLIMDAGWHPAP